MKSRIIDISEWVERLWAVSESGKGGEASKEGNCLIAKTKVKLRCFWSRGSTFAILSIQYKGTPAYCDRKRVGPALVFLNGL